MKDVLINYKDIIFINNQMFVVLTNNLLKGEASTIILLTLNHYPITVFEWFDYLYTLKISKRETGKEQKMFTSIFT